MPELHVFFRKIDIERPRHKRGFPGKKPERDNVQHGSELKDTVTVLQRSFEETTKTKPPEFDPAFIFRLKVEEKAYVSEDEWRRSNLTVLSDDPDGAVVLFSPDQLSAFSHRIGAYSKDVPKGQKHPSQHWIASITTDMALWSRQDRIGPKLAGIQLGSDEYYRLDVELWHYGSNEECRGRMSQLRQFIVTHQGEFLDSYVGPTISIARVRLTGHSVNELLDVGIVHSIDLPPQPQLSVGQMINTQLDDINMPIPIPSENAPRICVIDSGISRGHPLLANAVGDTIAIPERLGDGLDDHGHGTQVAGIALYGDVKTCLDNLDFQPEFFLLSAKVTNNDNRFDDDSLIVTQMRLAIEYFVREYDCRVFNISLGDPRLVFHDNKPSAWSHMLDTLAREYDIVLVVPTGNVPVLGVLNDEAEKIRSQYPNYLLENESRIIEPATAANVITVGSLANSETSHSMINYPNDPAIRCVTSIDQPSPFTRCGPGVNNAIKPEVCEYGGNVTWDGRLRVIQSDRETGVITTNRIFRERLFTSHIGTSLAAPKVAHLAAQILKYYPDASANLVRALIANSADIPQKTQEMYSDNRDDILRVCGYGKPDETKAIFSSDRRVTLIAEDVISVDKIHLYEIPIPDEFKTTRGRRQIAVTLAFDPPVRHTRKEYLGMKLKFKLLRGVSSDKIVEWYSERPKDVERIPAKFICKMNPSTTRIENGTLQKAVFTASQNRAFEDYDKEEFYVLISSQATWGADMVEDQPYAITITIEHLERPVELLNPIKQTVQVAERVRVRA